MSWIKRSASKQREFASGEKTPINGCKIILRMKWDERYGKLLKQNEKNLALDQMEYNERAQLCN